jgi:hypothetical protein
MASSLPWANVAGMSPGLLPLFVHRGSAISTIDTPARVVEQQ